MNGHQIGSYVFGGSSWFFVDGKVTAGSGSVKAITNEGGAKSLEESLNGFADALVYLVTRRPKRVASGFGKGYESQTGVVGRQVFKLDVAVPCGRIVFSLVHL